ncbi:MAG: hypothetical protein R2828_05130 [Saprospiraceae bacterium]
MLTPKTQFLTDEERVKCSCDPSSTDGTGASGEKDCIDKWKEDLESITNEYTLASARAVKAEGLYANGNEWKNKLKAWLDRAEKASDEVAKINTELSIFETTVETTVLNTGKTVDAIKLLLCIVKEVFDGVHELLRKSPPNPEKGLIQTLIFQIDCLTNIDERDKSAMISCITAYENQVKAVFELQKTIIELLLEILNLANLLHQKVGSPSSGLKDILHDLSNRIQGGTADDGYIIDWETVISPPPPGTLPDPVPPSPCELTILAPPDDDKLFPIFNNSYYKLLEKQSLKAEDTASYFKEQMEEERKKRDKALAKRTSLLEAIKASEAAEMAK